MDETNLKIPYKIKAKLEQFTIFFIIFCDFFFMAVEIESFFLLKKSTEYVDFSHSQIGFPQILIHTKKCLSSFYITYCVHIAYTIGSNFLWIRISFSQDSHSKILLLIEWITIIFKISCKSRENFELEKKNCTFILNTFWPHCDIPGRI